MSSNVALMRTAKAANHPNRGYIIPIGGAEDRTENPVILRRFVELCGGSNARIAIIPTASSLTDTGDLYKSVFSSLGVDPCRISILAFATRDDCRKRRYLKVLDRADGVFITGGDQVRLVEMLSATQVAAKMLSRNANGMHIAGTSAGASAMSAQMIASGKTGITPRVGIVELAAGLGLVDKVVIDQHFSQRVRLGRLLMAVAALKTQAGIGLDENTAAIIAPNDTLEVVGSGTVTIIAPSNLRIGGAASADDVVNVTGIHMHILVAGDMYDLRSIT